MAQRNQDFLLGSAPANRGGTSWDIFQLSQGNIEQEAGETGAWRPWEGWLALSFGEWYLQGRAQREAGGDGDEDDEELHREWGGENVQGSPGLG